MSMTAPPVFPSSQLSAGARMTPPCPPCSRVADVTYSADSLDHAGHYRALQGSAGPQATAGACEG